MSPFVSGMRTGSLTRTRAESCARQLDRSQLSNSIFAVMEQLGSPLQREVLQNCSAVVVEDADLLRAGLVQTLRRLGCTVVADDAVGDRMFEAMMRYAPDL